MFCVVGGRGWRRKTQLKRGVLKLKKVNTQKNEKINKTTTFLVPVGRFSPEVKTAAKTLLNLCFEVEKKGNIINPNHRSKNSK